MQTQIKYILSFVLSLLLITSCSDNDVLGDTSLEISETIVNFSKSASEKSISIKTNANQWSAYSAQEGKWFRLKQEGNNLLISVDENLEPKDRKAYIIVRSGSSVSKVEVIQAPAEEVIKLESDQIVLSAKNAIRQIQLETNVSTLQVVVENTPWLKAFYEKGDALITLDIEFNDDLYEREGTLLLTTSSGVKSVTVKQEGSLSLIMPLTMQVTTALDVIKYENARGNLLVKTPTGVFNRTGYSFYTGAKHFPHIEYHFKSLESQNFQKVLVFTSDVENFKGDKFNAFFESYGYKKTAEKDDRTEFENDKDHFKAFVKYEEKGGATINIEYDPQQPQAFPTFKDGIPPLRELWEYAGDFEDKIQGKYKQDVIEYETLNGGVKNDVLSNPPSRFWVFETTVDDGTFLAARGYKFYDIMVPPYNFDKDHPYVGQVTELYGYFDNVNLAYWKYDDEWKLTKEFRELLVQNNIVFVREQFGHFFYYHKDSYTMFDLTPMRFSNFHSGKEFLTVRIYRTKEM